MQEEQFTVRTRTFDRGVVVLTLDGELDLDAAHTLRVGLEAALATAASCLVLDCSGLLFCDSTGLNELLVARRSAEAQQCEIRLADLRPTVARMFEITGAAAIFRVHPTLEDALVTR